MLTVNKVNWRDLKAERKRVKRLRLEKKLQQSENAHNLTEDEIVTERSVNNLPKKRGWTLSIAVPGSILNNAQCAELQTYVVGQIARAACTYRVDEIVVFDDSCGVHNKDSDPESKMSWEHCLYMAKVLQYLECPQYLRKSLFPMSEDLQYVGLLNPLDAPHHLRANQHSIYREGVVTSETNSKGTKSLVSIGLDKPATADRILKEGTRVTLKLPPKSQGGKKLRGVIVAPSNPKTEAGLYWGYNVRLASSLARVFSECPYKRGYNLTVGTSDKGRPIADVFFKKKQKSRMLVMFGGVNGLEFALQMDKQLEVDEVELLFDYYLNTCPFQGTRTIRTEEAIPISLALITHKLYNESSNFTSEAPEPISEI